MKKTIVFFLHLLLINVAVFNQSVFALSQNFTFYTSGNIDVFGSSCLIRIGNIMTEPDGIHDYHYLQSTAKIGAWAYKQRDFSLLENSTHLNNPRKANYVLDSIVCQNSIMLGSQAEVDAFDCNEITGRLTISGEDISDLSPLFSLNKVNGGVYITNNPMLTSLRGFENLSQITNTLSITDNDNLNSLYHLSHLSGTIGMVQIERNPKLYSLQYLGGITKIDSELVIKDLPDLTSLKGFENIEQTLHIKIENNASLASLVGLENLKSVKSLSIESNGNLRDLSGLDSLTHFKESLSIKYNQQMTSLDGLNLNPSFIPNAVEIVITDNPQLSSCCVLDELVYIPKAQISLVNNRAVCSGLQAIANVCRDATVICEGDIVISTQQEVNTFDCNAITGSLTVSGEDITDLSPLIQLDAISGYLAIENNPQLISLSGLENLSGAIGDLYVIDNPLLTSLKELDKISSNRGRNGFHSTIFIQKNPSLISLDGLSGFKAAFHVRIDENDMLQNLAGLENLDSLFHLYIDNNKKLNSLQSLELDQLHNLEIYNNDKLTTLTGLESLTSIKGNLYIGFNDQLNSLKGLNNLTILNNDEHIPVILEIESNPNLSSLSSLENLEDIGALIRIRHNEKLSDCCILDQFEEWLEDDIHVIHDNAKGCDSNSDILTTCAPAVCDGDVSLSSQAEVNASRCSMITGSLTISGSGITDLSPLIDLDSISGSLTIENTGLVTLNGLDSLKGAVENLYLSYNPHLESITSLMGINRIGNDLVLFENPKTVTLNGLNNVKSAKNVDIYGNNSLVSLEGLEGIQSVNLLWLNFNKNLVSLTGLNIEKIEFNLLIAANPNLTSLSGLEELTANDNRDVEIFGNKKLAMCCILLQFPDFVTSDKYNITNNATGCNGKDEILTACSTTVQAAPKNIGITLSPNPMTSNSTLQLVGIDHTDYQNTTYVITDMAHNTLLSGDFEHGKATLSKSYLDKGFYFCQVFVDGKLLEVARIAVE